MSLTFGSLFAGIGGIDLGLERAGMECRWQVENDAFCTKVLEKHWPTVRRYGDIKALDAAQLEPVDLIAGGFPCPPVSLAGRRAGQADDRWLWDAFAHVLANVQPSYVIVENVPGLLSADQGAAFGAVQSDLAVLGYDTEWHCIPAAAAGSPQLRYRVFLVAYPEGFAERAGLRSDEPTSIWRGRLGYGGGEDRTWPTEPGVRLVANGVSDRLERLRALGNAVVPAVAEMVGRQLLEVAA